MHDMSMDNDSNRSSTENSLEHGSTDETVQKKDEKSSSISDDGNPIAGLADERQRTVSSSLSQIGDQPKCLASQLEGVASENTFAESGLQHPDHDFQLSTDRTERIDERTVKFQKNLEKFLKEREPLKEVQLRKKTDIPRRLLKSDGEMVKIISDFGDMLKHPSTHFNRSSAPPTLSNETEEKEKSESEKLSCAKFSEKNTAKAIDEALNIFKKDTAGTKTSSPAKALDVSVREISPFKVPISPTGGTKTSSQAKTLDVNVKEISPFKVPISPNVKKTPDKSAKMLPVVSKEDSVTPAQSRPTHFTMKPRKAFYTFSPGSSSGLLRCQSLPEINRPRRKDEAQRRSINFDEHSRIVRSLFRDKPDPVTPESKVSTFHKSNCFLEIPERTENAPEEEVSNTSQNIPSNICRKLVFSSCSKETSNENQKEDVKKGSCVAEIHENTFLEKVKEDDPKILQSRPLKSCRKLIFGSSSQETTDRGQQIRVPCDAESPPKRKNESPVETGCFISTKKVRTSLETEVESECGDIVRKSESSVDTECSILDNKIGTGSETKTEECIRVKIKLSDLERSINARTSLEKEVGANASSENVRKNVSPIDVVCSTSAKKAKTSSEKLLGSSSDENAKNHVNPADVRSSDSMKKETTFSETKIKGSGSE